MKKLLYTLLLLPAALSAREFSPREVLTLDLGTPVKQCRLTPLDLGSGERGFVTVFSAEKSIDPYEGSFTFPKDTPKIAVFDASGRELWRRELPHTIPGVWFMPLLPMDMDGDGCDEIYYVANTCERPFDYDGYRLERADARTGRVTGSWRWPAPAHNQANSYKWRFLLIGGHADDGSPVLVTVQGTYKEIQMQGWNGDMSRRWKVKIPDDGRGARGSHSTPVFDLRRDGREQFMYGERCFSFDTGEQLFILDGDAWNEHSDLVQPWWDTESGRWCFFTTREKGDDGKQPRAVMFDQTGRRLWEITERKGHYHHGWVGNFGPRGERIVMAGRYPFKGEAAPPKGCVGKTYDARTGEEVKIDFPIKGTVVDFNGDGIHELYTDGTLYDRTGRIVLTTGKGILVAAKKVLPLAGEQIVVARPDGRIVFWADRNARENPARFDTDVYRDNVRLSSVGYGHRYPVLNF